ncbi:DUF2169 domain-containing protein [Pseudenhygromyxa sp. WMMC2535]|uniref:DUF2169 family type VI secretion system accessory protein n=1 Tax=Pseudenhygromyxa sp. WMMC2535 TaxID=2712867 RepID=UPI001552316A|nr:DUF2169 domain-containing protein [Pseudenhygromyxa sp. WMMC2535]NVB42448.1 DUF2169 domain-containing protein [Pseudenhygromyxa sp. WMMC2535]
MKVIKPQQLGVLTRCFEHGRRFYMGVSALAMFPLGRTDTLSHEVGMWKLAAERLGAEGALDYAIPKSRAEFLLGGIAFPPGGQPAPAVPVRASVGGLQKDLAVFGDRFWTGDSATEPQPFTQMAINWAHAFGGKAYPHNPFGKGIDEVELDGFAVTPLPNVEAPRELIDSPNDRPQPAGFGPLDLAWPQRQRLAGTYDQDWLENLFPGYARDVDWEIHNIAAPDQRRDGFWQGGERYRFDNLHPSKVVEGELPRFRARVFINRSHAIGEARPPGPDLKQMVKQVPARLEEIQLALQTLWFFPDAELGVMIWSGSTIVAEELGEDIVHLLVAAEHDDRPRPVEHYLKVASDRLDPETGALAMLVDDELLPEGLGETESPLDEELELSKFESFRGQNMRRRQVELAEAGRAEVASHGLDPDVHGPPIPEPVDFSPPSPKQLPALIEDMKAKKEQLDVESKAKIAKAQAEVDAIIDDAGIDDFTSETLHEEQNQPGQIGPPTYTAAAILKMLQDMAAQTRATGYINDEIEEMIVDEELYAQWEEAERGQRQAYHMGAHFQQPAPAMPAEMRGPTRARLRQAIAAGEDFTNLNFTGANLSRMDLRGVDLSGAYLESADLSDSNLSGARLDGAVLAHAKLTRTRLEGASLVDVNLGKAKISGAIFTDADLSEANLYGARFEESSLIRAKLKGAKVVELSLERCDASGCFADDLVFIKVELRAVNLRHARLDRTLWHENDLRGSAFDGASLVSATFLGVDIRQVGFREAKLDNARFVEDCKLDAVVFSGASMLGTYCRGLRMRGAEIRHATVDGADFSESDLAEAKFYRVVARGASFEMANLRQAEMISGNFMNASFARAVIEGADFRAANLYAADMARVRSDAAVQLEDALLTKVRIHPRLDDQVGAEGGGAST